jgi:hypothetical protein
MLLDATGLVDAGELCRDNNRMYWREKEAAR